MDKLVEIYENMLKEEKEKIVTNNPTLIDKLQERIAKLEESVALLTSKLNG